MWLSLSSTEFLITICQTKALLARPRKRQAADAIRTEQSKSPGVPNPSTHPNQHVLRQRENCWQQCCNQSNPNHGVVKSSARRK
jgi:hypothetical protein